MASNSTPDISNRYGSINDDYYGTYVNRTEAEKALKELYEDKTTLDFTDMLQLMIAEFQNQTIDNQASTTDMMNQLVQMSTMQAMRDMVDHVEELRLSSVMSYAASLVDKEVTVFDGWDKNGQMIERVGTVTGMGTYGGQQVVFVDGDMYYLSDILAVGKLPPKKDNAEKPGDGDKEPDDIDPDFGVDSEEGENGSDSEVGGAGASGGSNPEYTGDNGVDTE